MESSVLKTARLGGVLYLVNIVFGFFAIGFVPSLISVPGDPIATAKNLLEHEQFYRFGLAAHVIILLTNIPLALVFYRLFKDVDKSLTFLVVFFTLVGTAIEAANLLNAFAPLVFLKDGAEPGSFTPEQLATFAHMHSRLEGIGFNVALVFFGSYGIIIGRLIYKSGFLPKIVGVMMAIGGSCYLFNSFASFLAPGVAASLFPYIQLPSGIGELTFCLWLLIKGVNLRKWESLGFSG